jgi:chromosomal replication initiation ATPase DnaA
MEKQAIIQTIISKTVEVLGAFEMKSRKTVNCEPRQVVMYLILHRFKELKLTQDRAGEVFNYSHGNAIHGAKRISGLITGDKKLKSNVELIEKNIRDAINLN